MIHSLTPTKSTASNIVRRDSYAQPVTAGSSTNPRDTIDLVEIWALVRRHRLAILGIGALVFTTVMAFTLASQMSFRANSRLYLGELSDKARSAGGTEDELELLGTGGGDVGSEVEILKSRSLVTRAALDSGLNVHLAAVDASKLRYWRWLASRRDLRLLDGADQEVLATDTRLTSDAWGAQTYKVVFKSEQDFELWKDQRMFGRGVLGQTLNHGELSVRLLRGRSGLPKPGAEYWMTIFPLSEVVDGILDNLEVSAAKTPAGAEPVKVVGLGFSADSPRLAATFLDRLMAAYLEERQSWKTENATAAGTFVTSQLTGMRETLDDIEKRLADYRTQNRVVVLDNEAKAMIEQVGKYEEQRVAARLEVSALAGVKNALKHPDVPAEAFMVGEAKDTVLEGMAASLAKSRQELTELEARFNGPAPNLREQRQQVEAQRAAIKSYVAGRLQRAQENLGTLDHIIGKFEERLRTVPGAELGLTRLARESEVYSNLYSYLLKRQQQTAIIKASTVSKNRVLDAPQAPHREDSPRLLLRLASAPLGLLVGALAVVLWRLWGGTFQSESDVRRTLGTMPVFGRLPMRRKARRKRGSEIITPATFPAEESEPLWLEAIRTLRTNVYHATDGVQRPVIMVTSPAGQEGTTACVASLAEMLAADAKAVLVIDTQLRRATGAREASPDLRNVLQGAVDWRYAVRSVQTPNGQFHVLSANGPARAELLSGDAMRTLLRSARACYDVVVLDVASFPATSDALILVPHVDCILSVIRLRSTPRRAAVQHFRELSSDVPHAVVLNEIEPDKTARVALAAPDDDMLPPVPIRPVTEVTTIPGDYRVVSSRSVGGASSTS